MTSDAWQIYLRGQNTRHKETEESIPLRAKISRGWPLTACKSDNKSHPSVPLSKYRGRWWNGASRGLRLASTPAKSCRSQQCILPPGASSWCRRQFCFCAEMATNFGQLKRGNHQPAGLFLYHLSLTSRRSKLSIFFWNKNSGTLLTYTPKSSKFWVVCGKNMKYQFWSCNLSPELNTYFYLIPTQGEPFREVKDSEIHLLDILKCLQAWLTDATKKKEINPLEIQKEVKHSIFRHIL